MKPAPTGVPELDLILGGGLPRGSLVVLAGGPGTGKTILAQQIAFALATPEHHSIYYTTFSEPHAKLVEHLSEFTFFDAASIGGRIEFLHVGELLTGTESGVDRDLPSLFSEILREGFSTEPALIVLDSSRALHDFVDPAVLRQAIYELASGVAASNATLLFVGEYSEPEIAVFPEFAIADVILEVAYEPREPADKRWLRVIKRRGARHLEGKHTILISKTGVEVYPRLERLPGVTMPPVSRERLSTGIAEFDEMLGGGLHAGDTTALLGPTGTGKTALALKFIVEGLQAGESGLYISFQETEQQLIDKANVFGWAVEDAIADGRFVIHYVPHGEINLDSIGALVRRELNSGTYRRVVLDSLAELVLAAGETERFPAYSRMLTGIVRSHGASLVITSETNGLGPNLEAVGGLSFLFQNVVVLRYLEIDHELRRTLSILKMRDSGHSKSVVEFEIGASGPAILKPLNDTPGTITDSESHPGIPGL